MGVLRLLLALSVLFDHQGASALLMGPGGEISVQCFYIISGFYIALVLDRTYRSNAVFWANRALRLFPSYWAVAAVTLVIWLVLPTNLWTEFSVLPNIDRAFVAVSNFALVGQDWFNFLGFRHGHLALVKDFQDSDFPFYNLLLVPPAWSLGVELSFYALAPFILRRGWATLLGCLLMSLGLRFLLSRAGLDHNPWTYRFFPSELATFLTGSAAYRVYCMVQPRLSRHKWLARAITLLVWSVVACMGLLQIDASQKRVLALVLIASALPFLSEASRASRLDRFLGDLSYPIYICHWTVIRLVNRLLEPQPAMARIAATVVIVFAVSIALKLCIDGPIESSRARLRSRSNMGRRQP